MADEKAPSGESSGDYVARMAKWMTRGVFGFIAGLVGLKVVEKDKH